MSQTTASMIASLNDQFRHGDRTLGEYNSTRAVAALPPEKLRALTRAIKIFDDFTEDNDPHGEHDMGEIELDGDRFFWKIDYYDHTLCFGAEDPSGNHNTTRVLTIMLASEY